MQGAFATVLWVVCGLGILIAVLTLVGNATLWEDYGKRHMMMEHDLAHGPSRGSAADLLERDTEIREMLQARNDRRQRRGEAPIDVEAELARLTLPPVEAELARPAAPRADAGLARPAPPVDPELARPAPQIDAELRSEIRDLVIARNHRRARAGKPPLDVDAEIEREIVSLSGL